ncbi:hypothetical protein Alvin_3252 (plasmid) [Allochromatium vinosum DSM 180]|uniref:Uncharacterized protein n=1 Tax=Allochromatium vinosum (strain ATCC 17899 / DSM 180 / NBRC 103801 / NCIMB 10441 / D) TaxID=572477 RepID=D3RWD1_ALLVD|nr:hypothetical protein Alvin_3252 [Allochromatium vinosum DSM 180]
MIHVKLYGNVHYRNHSARSKPTKRRASPTASRRYLQPAPRFNTNRLKPKRQSEPVSYFKSN